MGNIGSIHFLECHNRFWYRTICTSSFWFQFVCIGTHKGRCICCSLWNITSWLTSDIIIDNDSFWKIISYVRIQIIEIVGIRAIFDHGTTCKSIDNFIISFGSHILVTIHFCHESFVSFLFFFKTSLYLIWSFFSFYDLWKFFKFIFSRRDNCTSKNGIHVFSIKLSTHLCCSKSLKTSYLSECESFFISRSIPPIFWCFYTGYCSIDSSSSEFTIFTFSSFPKIRVLHPRIRQIFTVICELLITRKFFFITCWKLSSIPLG